MSYQCINSNCPTVPYFSSPNYAYQGTKLGDSRHDNARMVGEQAATVASFSEGGGPSITSTQYRIPLCFSGANTLEVHQKGLVTMDALKIGDYVKVGNNEYSRVISFGHLDRESQATFLQIKTLRSSMLEISDEHLLYLQGTVAIQAKTVQVGDVLANGDEVVSIATVIRRGMYAPATESGKLLVSGVLASSYVSLLDVSPTVNDWLSHAFYAPLRLACRIDFAICERETYTDGVTNFYYYVVQAAYFLQSWSAWIHVAVAMVVFPYVAVFAFADKASLAPCLLYTILFAVTTAFACRRNKAIV
jgi:Hint module